MSGGGEKVYKGQATGGNTHLGVAGSDNTVMAASFDELNVSTKWQVQRRPEPCGDYVRHASKQNACWRQVQQQVLISTLLWNLMVCPRFQTFGWVSIVWVEQQVSRISISNAISWNTSSMNPTPRMFVAATAS